MADFPNTNWCLELLDPQNEQAKRRSALLQAAFDVLAEVGFEGLRTRAVAKRAGVNIATLHYYFPSKQDLVEGLAQFIGAKFVTIHAPAPTASGFPALDRLRQEFSDGRYYFKHQPEMLLVMQEFVLRGKRDPDVQKIVERMNYYWRQGIEKMVLAGVADGTFRKDIDAADLTALLMAIFAGTGASGSEHIDTIEQLTESWILSDAAKQKIKPRPVTTEISGNSEQSKQPFKSKRSSHRAGATS